MKNVKYLGELKEIDTEEKAYLLGQIYGDGLNVSYKRKDKNWFSYKTEITSTIDDTEMYEKLSKLFPFFKLTKYNSQKSVVFLCANQKQLYLDLVGHGMISNKVKHDKTFEFHFPQLREDLVHHFIRGYFDADGSAWFPSRKRSRNNLHIEFGCNTKNFLSKINEILLANGMEFTYNERYKTAGNGKRYRSCILFSSNSSLSRKFANYIYKDATIYLQRKYDICYREPELRPFAYQIYGPCPDCGSTHITMSGTRDGKRRLICKNCNRHFTRPMPK